jgi:hypothetical protein
MGCAWAAPHPGALSRWSTNEHQRRFRERDQVLRRKRLDFVSRGDEQVTKSDPGAKLKALDRAGRDRQRDHSVSDRAG